VVMRRRGSESISRIISELRINETSRSMSLSS
jgi:hypothetical protein